MGQNNNGESQSRSIQLADSSKTLSQFLGNPLVKERLSQGLTKRFTPERLGRMAIIAVTKTPFLLKCTMESFALALSSAGQLGLECDGLLGRAYLVPFKNNKLDVWEAQFMIGYRGMIDLMRRSGEVLSFNAHIVHDKDHFKAYFGSNERIEHAPVLEGDAGEWKFVYSVAKLKGGGESSCVMNRQQVYAIRDKSQSYKQWLKDGKKGQCIWVDFEEEMVKKTCVRQHFKFLPATVESEQDYDLISKAMEIENRDFESEKVDPPEGSRRKPGSDFGFGAEEVEAEPVNKETGEVAPKIQPHLLPWLPKINACVTADDLGQLKADMGEETSKSLVEYLTLVAKRINGEIDAPPEDGRLV